MKIWWTCFLVKVNNTHICSFSNNFNISQLFKVILTINHLVCMEYLKISPYGVFTTIFYNALFI